MEKKLIVDNADSIEMYEIKINDLIDKLKSIVEKYGDTCFVSYCNEGILYISHERYENEDEFQSRLKVDKLREYSERAKYEELKAKYG